MSPRIQVAPTKSLVVIMTGGVKEDVSQLELTAGELLQGENYQEIDGAYHGYASVPGYERYDGTALTSTVDIDILSDYGDDSNAVLLLESDCQDDIQDVSVAVSYTHLTLPTICSV